MRQGKRSEVEGEMQKQREKKDLRGKETWTGHEGKVTWT